MNGPRLVVASLRHYWRTNLGVGLGFSVAGAVLIGALLVGSSVRHGLRQQTLARIGRVDAALSAHDRFLRAALADELAGDLEGVALAPALRLSAVATAAGGARRANEVVAHGIDARFLALAPAGDAGQGAAPAAGETLLSRRLAAQLAVEPGEEIVLRVERPSALPRDMVLATTEDASLALRVRVARVLDDAEFGRFGLEARPLPPFNAFVSLDWLQGQLELPGRANLLLAAAPTRAAGGLTERLDAALRARWTLADGELVLREIPDGGWIEVATPRVFLDAPVERAARALDLPLVGVLTYFVNTLRHAETGTPYSMVSALGPLGASGDAPDPLSALVPADLAPDELVAGEWLAADQGLAPGAELELAYFVPGPDRALIETARTFRVRDVVPLDGLAGDPSLMPDFPGLEDAENCRDWETGVPVELDAIRDVDEAYWDEHRGTPKAFVSLAAGQQMWANRFGTLTAIRAPLTERARLEEGLRAALSPADLGLFFQDVRGPALRGGDTATDFGGLFLGLSFFLIASALLLTALLFVFGVEQRGREIGTLLAVGFRPSGVRRLFLGEAAILALGGTLVGALFGTLYARGVLRGLATVWSGAVASTEVAYHPSAAALAGGALATIAVALLATAWALRSQVRRPAGELLSGAEGLAADAPAGALRRARLAQWIALTFLLGAVALVASAGPSAGMAAAGTFFGAGALLLVAGLALSRWVVARVGGLQHGAPRSVEDLGRRNAARRPGRSLATVALLACGTFLVLSIGAHRKLGAVDAGERSSGTGGFALYGRSALPVVVDLATPEGRDAYGLLAPDLAGVSVAALRVREGDEASCLNLGSPQTPRLLGVDPDELARRGAFSFAATSGAREGESPWELLAAPLADGSVPAIADGASAKWTMKKGLGEPLQYVDERGAPFTVRLVGLLSDSILQGNVLIAEDAFRAAFPSESGYRAFLIDAPPERVDELSRTLGRALSDVGLELTPAARRLDEFNAVQNTYLDIFQVLGGLGVLLGSAGLGIVVLRNALERRQELAVARAVGFSVHAVRRLLVGEHLLLLALGLGVGALSSLVALLPVLGSSGGQASPGLALPLLVLLGLNGLAWVWLASVLAARGPLLAALRNE